MKGKKLLSILISSVLAASAVNVTYVAAEPASFFGDIGEDFSDTASIPTGSDWGRKRWTEQDAWKDASFVQVNGVAGKTAAETDYALSFTNSSSSSNWVRFYPNQGADNQGLAVPGKTWGYYETYPSGMAMEISYDFAVTPSTNAENGEIKLGLNQNNTYVQIGGTGKELTNICVYGTNYDIDNISLLDEDGNAMWHKLSTVIVYDEGTVTDSVNSGTGRIAFYLDDEVILSKSFNWSGTYTGSRAGSNYKNQQLSDYNSSTNAIPWDNNSVWGVIFSNLSKNHADFANIGTNWSPAVLYVDNLKLAQPDYSELQEAIDDAEAEIEAYGDDYGASAVATLEAKIDAAKAIIAGTGMPIAQSAVADEADALLAELEKLQAGEIKLFEDITEDFNDTTFMDNIGGQFSQVQEWLTYGGTTELVAKNGVYGAADTDDYCLSTTRPSSGTNRLAFFPVRDKWGKLNGENYLDGIPAGTIVETSIDFASDYSSDAGDASHIYLNGAGDSAPVRISISATTGKITTITTSDGSTVSVNKSLLGEDGNPKWHNLKIMSVYPTETSGIGYVTVYLDGEELCDTQTFSYSGTYAGHSGFAGKDQHINYNNNCKYWDGDTINDVWIATNFLNGNNLYIDNLKMSIVTEKKVQLKKALDAADALLDAAAVGTDLGQHPQADVDSLKAKMAAAWSAYNNKTSDYTGAAADDAAYTLYTQNMIDTALTELTAETAAFPAKAVSEKLYISKSTDGSMVTAQFKKQAFTDGVLAAKVIVAVYDTNDKLLGVAVDTGSGSLSFTGVGASGEVKKLSAELDISEISGATVARAFVWNSLTGMEPIVDSVDLSL
ncbi:MAG: hypothetical protein J6C82_08235 [Clostridia bacterium]|nr:hypothetical protein [Clostridia bacterium]MBP3360242.1 hypothetical protein [Clostridia bacterium]